MDMNRPGDGKRVWIHEKNAYGEGDGGGDGVPICIASTSKMNKSLHISVQVC